MKRIINTLYILAILCLGIWIWKKEQEPKPRTKVPATRYTGYAINRESIERAKDFTVLISDEGFGSMGRGTGILVDSTHVLTCAHMIEGAPEDMWIFPYPGNIVVKGKPVSVNEKEDLALIELSTPVVVAHYAVFNDSHYDGEPITIIGNTMGCMKWFVSFGIVSGDWEGYVLTDGMLYGGNSGGPWINEKGEVVALTDWTLIHKGMESGVHGGVSAITMHKFLLAAKSPSIGEILQMILGGGK